MPFTQRQFFKTIGYIFLLWCAANTYLSFSRYGWDEGMYWWFCNLCLGSMGAVLVWDHWGWGLGWISVALATQTFWITDNFHRIFTGNNLFGLVEFMYQPGNPWDEFLLSHYHFYILPVGITYLFVTQDQRRLPAAIQACVHASIFFVSWLFPVNQNVNCIHRTCMPGMEWMAGPVYSVLFTAFICGLSLAIGAVLEPWIKRHRPSEAGRTKAVRLFSLWCLFTVALLYLDVREKSKIPAFHCTQENKTPGEAVFCRFTLEGAPKVLEMHYDVENKDAFEKKCETLFRVGELEKPSPDFLRLAPHERRKMTSTLRYPMSEMTLNLRLKCEPWKG